MTQPTRDSAEQNPERSLGHQFALFWLGEAVSVLGVAASSLLLPMLAIHRVHAGPMSMGLIAAAPWVPWVLVGLPAGAWVDKLAPRPVMIAADIVSAVATITLPVATAMHILTLPHIVVVAFLLGLASVFFRTAYAKLVPALVQSQHLERANARLMGTESAMQVVGPGVAGRLSASIGPALGILTGAIGFLVSLVCLAMLRPTAATVAQQRPHQPLRQSIGEGVRYLWHDRFLRWIALIGAVSNFGLTGFGAMLVLYLTGLGMDESRVGTYFAIGAVGGIMGAVVIGPLARRFGTGRMSTLTLLGSVIGLLIGLPVTATTWWLSVIGYAGIEMMVVGGNVVRSAWRQRYVPHHLLGRTIAAMQIINYGAMPLAGLAAGVLGITIGVRPTVLLMTAVFAVASWAVLVTPFARLRDLPDPPKDTAAISPGTRLAHHTP